MTTCSLVYMTLYVLSANIPALFFSTEPNLIASIGYIFLIKRHVCGLKVLVFSDRVIGRLIQSPSANDVISM